MRILIVTNMYPTVDRPGYGIFVKEQIEALKRCCNDIEIDVEYINGIDGLSVYLKSIKSVDRRIRQGNYDLVHVHYGLSGLFLLNPLRKKIPVVITLHGGDIQKEQGKRVQVALTKQILKRADAAITLNERMTRLVTPYCSNVEIIPCAVDTEIFTAPSIPRKSGNRPLKVIFPSDRNRVVKNYPLFNSIMNLLREKHGIDTEVTELKGMTRQQVASTLRNVDLMVMTSISEGSPQAVKEAMACNLPVVTTKVGDVEYLLSGVANSTWFNSYNPEDAVQRIIDVINGKITGISGREQVFKLGLDNDSISHKLLNTYDRVTR